MKLNLVMPMAGRGSRFAREGITEPKPLVDLGGKPFFWWAVESVRRACAVEQMAFVVLEEHEANFSISSRIHQYYPQAKIVRIPEVTAGSAETAAVGLKAIESNLPVAINDCDHAFLAGPMDATMSALAAGSAGALMTFRSSNPGFSYVQLDQDGAVCGTVEKQVASPYAIAGCYLFRSPLLYLQTYERYLKTCAYNELFISGIYNELLLEKERIGLHVLEEHFPFGTPEEYRAVRDRMLGRLKEWI